MSKFAEFLEQLDLSDIEASLYTALLDNGPTSVRDLAVLTKMKRTTAYFYIDQLIEKGLVVKLTRGTKKMVTVSQPKESLEYLVEQKNKQAQEIKKEFPAILQTMYTTLPQIETNTDAEIKYLKGKNSLRKVYEEALSGNELRTYVKIEESNSPFPEDVDLFQDSLKKNKKLVIKELFYNSPLLKDNAPHILAKNPGYSFKLMPEDLKLTSGDILIYDKTVAIINYQGEITCVVLKNNDFYNTLKVLFELIWKSLA